VIGPEKIMPLSNMSQMASHGTKTYSKSRIELRNLQIKENAGKTQVSVCHQSSLVIQKAWMLDVALELGCCLEYCWS